MYALLERTTNEEKERQNSRSNLTLEDEKNKGGKAAEPSPFSLTHKEKMAALSTHVLNHNRPITMKNVGFFSPHIVL